jgi:hypothetical protein
MPSPEYVEQEGPGAWRMSVWVQPGAKADGLDGTYRGRLKIRLKAPPVEGKANKALLKYVSEILGLKKNQVTLISGDKSRGKTLLVVSDARPDWPEV